MVSAGKVQLCRLSDLFTVLSDHLSSSIFNQFFMVGEKEIYLNYYLMGSCYKGCARVSGQFH